MLASYIVLRLLCKIYKKGIISLEGKTKSDFIILVEEIKRRDMMEIVELAGKRILS